VSAILNQLGIDQTFYHQFIIFAVIFFVLAFIFFRPFLELLEKRHQKTVADREAAIQLMADADQKFEEYKKKIAEERALARKHFDSVVAEVKKEESEIIGKARAEAKKITQDTVDAITQQQDQVKQKLAADVEMFAQSISEKLLQRPIGK